MALKGCFFVRALRLNVSFGFEMKKKQFCPRGFEKRIIWFCRL